MDIDRRDLLWLSGALLSGGSLSGCLRSAPTAGVPASTPAPAASTLEREPDPGVSTERLDELVRGNTDFAFDLLTVLTEDAPTENAFFSPYSISIAMAMVWAGTQGTTGSQIADTLQFPLDRAAAHSGFNQLDQTLAERAEEAAADGEHELTVANALWGQEDYPFLESYLDTLAVNYGAGVNLVDFASDPRWHGPPSTTGSRPRRTRRYRTSCRSR
ncbi:MAG: serpin family protein [Halobacteriota archaeon]